MELIIGTRKWSSWSLRPWLLMTELRIPFTETLVPFQESNHATFSRFSPNARVPCLHDGDTVVWDSLAIIEFGQEDAPARGVATYFVRDNGQGFEPGSASLLFEPFQRRLASRGRAGDGLGLAAVKRIVALHGGEVWAECEPGVATIFRFTLERSPQGLQLC